jgi:uncharacterized protein YjbI with pentapeptide repeats
MAEERPEPPESAEELLRRYATGARDFAGADLRGADLRGADLHGADLRGADLHGADLSGADLSGADLSGADLPKANLTDANLSGARLSGASLTEAHLRGANLSGARLSGAVLTEAHLRGASLIGTDLSSTDLRRADLIGGNLSGANLSGAHLNGASLRGADLNGANISNANLHGADMSEVDLSQANLSRANFRGANLGGARLAQTILLGIELSPFCDTNPPVVHHDASSVDFRSILMSVGSPNLKDFLQRTGMPEVFIEYDVSCALSLETKVFAMLQSTFISYGSPDEPFARKLYEALHRNGVTTFFFAEHAVPGDKLHRMMRKGVNEHDRVILVCSKTSLDRKGVLNEIEETLARESRDGGAAYLIPIRLDGYVFSGWAPPNADTAQSVRDRVVADFEGADTDRAKFDTGVRKLIAALKK